MMATVLSEKKPRGNNKQRRSQIVQHLRQHGDIVDKSGRASRELEQAIGGEPNPASFAQLLTAMDRAGQITREVRGKRTYRITVGPNADSVAAYAAPPAASAPPAGNGAAPAGNGAAPAGNGSPAMALVPRSEDGIDYDDLALALLRRVARSLAPPAGEPGTGASARAERRIVSLERRLNDAERAVARAGAENDELRRENADLQARLDASSQTIDNLMGQLNQRRTVTSARDRLDAEDKKALAMLQGSRAEDTQTG